MDKDEILNMINGCLNRICVTDDKDEIYSREIYIRKYVEMLIKLNISRIDKNEN